MSGNKGTIIGKMQRLGQMRRQEQDALCNRAESKRHIDRCGFLIATTFRARTARALCLNSRNWTRNGRSIVNLWIIVLMAAPMVMLVVATVLLMVSRVPFNIVACMCLRTARHENQPHYQ
jgi:hypothetical protein